MTIAIGRTERESGVGEGGSPPLIGERSRVELFEHLVPMHRLVESEVDIHPGRTALIFEKQEFSYQDINQEANQIARFLHRFDVKNDDIISVFIGQLPQVIITVLGILKAGCACLTLDPSVPRERCAYILTHANPRIVLTERKLADSILSSLEYSSKTATVCIEEMQEMIRTECSDNFNRDTQLDDLACLAYTSGSTGKPKGVMLPHRSFANFIGWHNRTKLTQGRGLLFSSTSYDVFYYQAFSILASGGTLILISQEVRQNPHRLLDLIIQKDIQKIYVMNAVLQLLARIAVDSNRFPASLREVVATGEQVTITSEVRQLFKVVGATLYNQFGASECQEVTAYQLSRNVDEWPLLPPIGKPIDNMRVYILDDALQPVPDGAVGHLYIAGAGLAQGYLDAPELTRERFVQSPFSQETLYKIGDLGRYLPDGNIEYAGRSDFQVKIRGSRVEVSEVEAALIDHDDIKQAYVMAVRDPSGTNRLVAYLVSNNPALTRQSLYEFLSRYLPDYMLPSIFVFLYKIPLTPGGKVDRKALPVPELEANRSRAFEAVQTPMEQTLAAIWQDLLHLSQVGRQDNFFELGGDSILCFQMISRFRRAGFQLTVKQVFEQPVLENLAGAATPVSAPCISQVAITGQVLLTPIQEWFLEQEWSEPHHFNQSVSLRLPANIQVEHLRQALAGLIVHHDALRLRFNRTAVGWQQEGADVRDVNCLDIHNLETLSESEQKQRIAEITNQVQASINLTSGCLLRAALFSLGRDAHHILFLTVHHLAVDGVSWRILVEDLHQAYQQLDQAQEVQLPPKTTAFQSWARQLHCYAQSLTMQQQASYWLGLPWSAITPYPRDYAYARTDNTFGGVAQVSTALGLTQTQDLIHRVPAAYHTHINDILLTALYETLGQWGDTTTILVNLEGHGREGLFDGVDISRTVGWFTSIFPVILQADAGADLELVLKTIKEQLHGIPDRGVGYGILRYLTNSAAVKEPFARLPEAELAFNYLGQFEQIENLGKWQLISSIEAKREDHSPLGTRRHLLEVEAAIYQDQLHVEWNYHPAVHHKDTIERLAMNYIQNLTRLIDHCLASESGGGTLSNFPLAQLTQAELERLTKAVPARQIADLYPLSPLQQGMLFHSIRDTEQSLYITRFVLTIRGVLRLDSLQHAVQALVNRHDSLRSCFIWEGLPQPLQAVVHEAEPLWTALDWQGLSSTEQTQHWQQFLHTQREQRFKLSHASLFSCTVLQLADQHYKVVITYHHMLSDGWSDALLLKELAEMYAAACERQTARLAPVRPYRDYIRWLQHQDLEPARAFWQQELSGVQFPTPLPTTTARATHDLAANIIARHFDLSSALTVQLQSWARVQAITLPTVILGVWALVLSQYSGESDVVFGMTVSDRPGELSGVEDMVGLFLNALPLRIVVDGKKPIREWFQQIQQKSLAIRHYAFVPLVEIQKVSQVSGHLPLFNSLVTVDSFAVAGGLRQSLSALNVVQVEPLFIKTNFPLALEIVRGETLTLSWQYDANRWSAAAIERLHGHFETLLEGLVADTHVLVGELSMLAADEEKRLLVDWNATQVEYPSDLCLHHPIEAQVERTPDSIAVQFCQTYLTYAELNARANQVAHCLQKLGVRADVLVGICVERSLEMVVGILGVLKASGAYVPIDPGYPSARIAFMLTDAAVPVLLTQQKLLARLPDHRARIVVLDGEQTEINLQPSHNPVCNTTAEHLSYAIYTSGSTGQPKGALIEHRAICNLMQWGQDAFPLDVKARVLQKTPFSFDASVWEFYAPLWVGATLVMAEPEAHTDAQRLIEALIEQRITVLQVVPTLLQVLLAAPRFVECTTLRRVFCGGEVLPASVCRQFYATLPSASLHNLYGPTEASIDSTVFTCPSDWEGDRVPVGRPIHNVQTYILNERLQPVPVGVVGELYIGGAGLGRGYLNRPELTAERFVANPFGEGRLYKTGDQARYLEDGNIEYLGRNDFQVKIRGFRIELGEIETVLQKHPQVRQAVVVVHSQPSLSPQLVAYVVPEADMPKVNAADLRRDLQAELPEHLIPNLLIPIARLPLAPSGKVDRRALSEQAIESVVNAGTFVVPETPREEALAQLWQDLLKLPAISRYANFFTIGGDSILSIRLVSRAQQIGLKFTPRDLFLHPTIAELARVVTPATQTMANQGVVTGPVPLTPIQCSFVERQLPNPHHYNQSILLAVPPTLTPQGLQQAFARLLEHHDALRLRLRPTDSGWSQSIQPPDESVSVERIDLSDETEAQQRQILESIADDYQASLNISDGPILRVALFCLGSNRPQRLLIVAHHLAIDGVSWRILLEDLVTAVRQLQAQQSIQLPAKTTSYQDWANDLVTRARASDLQAQLEPWLQLPWSEIEPFPFDHEDHGSDYTIADLTRITVTLNQEETRSLLHAVPAAYQTRINDILLTALYLTLRDGWGQETLLFYLEGHGRESSSLLPPQTKPEAEVIDLSRTVGWFTSIFPVILQVPKAQSELQALEMLIPTIKDQVQAAMQRGRSFGLLRYLAPRNIQASMASLPEPQLVFNYLGQFDDVVGPAGDWRIAHEPRGQEQSPTGHQKHPLEIEAIVQQGQLEVTWLYSQTVFTDDTIETLAQDYLSKLQYLIQHCLDRVTHAAVRRSTQVTTLAPQVIDDVLLPLRTHGARPPIFCMTGVEGYGFYLSELAQLLGSEQPFYALQARGLNGALPPLTSVEAIATQNIQVIQTVQSEGPYFMAGHSLGGLVAFEMAQQLFQRGQEIALVTIIDQPANLSTDEQNLSYELDEVDVRFLTERFTQMLREITNSEVTLAPGDLEHVLNAENPNALDEFLAQRSLWSELGNATRLRAAFDVFRCNVNSERIYRPVRAQPVRILLARSAETRAQGASGIKQQSEGWGWESLAIEPLDIIDVPGGHISMLRSPNVQVLAESLEHYLLGQ